MRREFITITVMGAACVGVAAQKSLKVQEPAPAVRRTTVHAYGTRARASEPASEITVSTKDNESARSITPVPSPTGELAPFVRKGVSWLIEAQQENGGWGGGSHAQQNIRDPYAVATDPGTSAFTAMALLRAGYSPLRGPYKESVEKALQYLLRVVESAPPEGPQVTTLTGTQPQAKMGQNVDTALCAQFFTRALHDLNGSIWEERITKALDKCLHKIESSQTKDGCWDEGGWAPALQSSLMNNALELGKSVGRKVDDKVLVLSRRFQKQQVDLTTGDIDTEDAAGIALYASSSNMRAVAGEAKAAEEIIARAKKEGRLEQDAAVSEESLRQAGVAAPEARELEVSYEQNEIAKTRAFDEQLLSGVGNNGGEEFLSYLNNSEALCIDGGDEWHKWNKEVYQRLAKIQNGDGSWSGHHCITSPVFCTAAVVACLTAERDTELLCKVAADSAEVSK